MTALVGTVEGSLNILWENYAQPAKVCNYRVLFSSYTSLKGIMPEPAPRYFDCADDLESYLVEKGLQAREAKNWVDQVHEKKNVSIPNVILRIEQASQL
jgi:hypothetical protein